MNANQYLINIREKVGINHFNDPKGFNEYSNDICNVYRDINYYNTDNHGHNILELYNILIQTQLTTSKIERALQYSKPGIRVPHELPNDLRLRILGNKEIVEKS